MKSPPASSSRIRQRWLKADFEQRRQLILETAMDLLHRRGLVEVTMRRVAQRLGVGAMTLYTYIGGQDELQRQMRRRGFELLHEHCQAASTLGSAAGWRGGAQAYVRFAITHPNLYELMFSVPYGDESADRQILEGGFAQLLERVSSRMPAQARSSAEQAARARAAAGRFWIALHGLASLAIAKRLSVLGGDVDAILDDLLPRIAPDDGA